MEEEKLASPPSLRQTGPLLSSRFPSASNTEINISRDNVKARTVEWSRRFGYACLPQVIRTKYYGEPAISKKVFSTSWLDGMRGVASWCVFNHHFLYCYSTFTADPYINPDQSSIFQLPIVRLPYQGMSAVCFFFLVAGYVTCLKPFKLMHKWDTKSQADLIQALSSSLFRRALRLYAPPVAASLFIVLLVRLNVYEISRPYMMDKKTLPGHRELHLEKFDTVGRQMMFWWQEMMQLTDVWHWKIYYPVVDGHLWTVPVMFRSSVVLSCTLLLVARSRHLVRMAILILVGLYCLWWDRWEIALHIWGACIALKDVVRDAAPKQAEAADTESLPTTTYMHRFDLNNRRQVRQFLYQASFYGALFLSLWLVSSPISGFETAPGYVFLSKFIPPWISMKKRFLPAVGATMFVSLLTTCEPNSPLRQMFMHFVPQYLGRISFMIYISNGCVLHTIGWVIPIFVWAIIGNGNTANYLLGLAVGYVISLFLTIWMADVLSREVDARSARFSQWAEEICTSRPT